MAVYRPDIPPHVAEVIRHLPPDIKRSVKQALRSLSADLISGVPLMREFGEIFGLETIGTIGAAETFGTGSSRGTAGTIGTDFSQVCSKRWTASIGRSNGNFFPTIPDSTFPHRTV